MGELPPALLDAIAFAARAHAGQTRKDGVTPYVSHVFRVCLIVRHLFEVDDPHVLMAAILHDTIEDTTTDFDDIEERFGLDVARWVAALTKEMRLREDERERKYCRELSESPWQVRVCKLADIYDNLSDSRHTSPEKRQRVLNRSRHYLDSLASNLPKRAEAAFQITANHWEKMKIEAAESTKS
jgi:guanosine-3',5'-bis(diphosphate) 3'-pyrophosphohydrolase